MREIKFRAWDKEAKKMIEPFWLKSLVVNYCDEFNYSSIHEDDLFLASQNELEFMQYTGLKDKNGKEIYEDDIVSGGEKIYSIGFHLGTFTLNNEKGEVGIGLVQTETSLEVIGNIYENPELLKG